MKSDFLKAKKNWDNFWKKAMATVGLQHDTGEIRRIQNSIISKYSKEYIRNKFGSFKNLKVIEIGSGRGEYSLPLALEGADITLLDYSQFALEGALKLYSAFGLKPKIIIADLFNLPEYLIGNFDISASYGLVEHYLYPQRQQLFNIHLSLLNEKGSTIIAVPNKFSPPYRLFKKIAELTGRWQIGTEIPFSIEELKICANKVGFKRNQITASSFVRDSLYFLINRPIYFLSNHKLEFMFSDFDIYTPVNNLFGFLFVLIAEK